MNGLPGKPLRRTRDEDEAKIKHVIIGLEEGCFAREPFHLNCTNMSSSAVLQLHGFHVIDMNVNDGTLKFTTNGAIYAIGEGPPFFAGFEESLH